MLKHLLPIITFSTHYIICDIQTFKPGLNGSMLMTECVTDLTDSSDIPS